MTDSPNTTIAEQLRALKNGWNDPNEVIQLAEKAAAELDRQRLELERGSMA